MSVAAQLGSVDRLRRPGAAARAPTAASSGSPGSLAWAAGLAGLAAYLAPEHEHRRSSARRPSPASLVAAAGGWALLRAPYLLAFATLACLPARIPVQLGDEDANLLLPLYVVVGSLAVALGWQLVVRRDTRDRELGPLAVPLAAFVAWTGLTLVWSVDLREGAIFVGAFVLPFGLLALGFARLPWRGRWLTWLWVALVGTALVYASIGVYQWATRDIFWNPKVIVGNAYAPFFRVNSIFWDPSIYGRYLTVGILTALAGILLGGVRGWRLAGLYGVVVAMWVGLFFSFSQSSFVALAAGVVVAALVVWGRIAPSSCRRRSCVVLALGSLAVPQVRHRVEKQVALGRQFGHERPRDARRAGPPDRGRAPARRRRRRRLQACLRRSDGASRQAAEEGCIPHDARHGRRRRGASGPPALRLALRRGAPRGPPRARPRLHVARVVRRGPYASGDHRAQLLLQRALRGSDDLGDARPRRARGQRSTEGGADVIEALAPCARPRAAHRRRRVRLRRHDGAPRRGRLRGALRRVLDRDALAAARVRAGHARARGARGDGRARDPRVAPDGARLRRAHVSRAPPGHPRAARRAVGGMAARCRLPALPPRRPPGPPDDRAGGPAGVQAHDDPRLRDPLEQLRLLLRRLRRRSSSATSSARSRPSRTTRRSSTAATRTPSTSGTSPRCTART